MSLTPEEQRAEKHIGPCPKGDPVAMEAAAVELQKIADDFAAQSLAMKATHLDGKGGVVERNNARAMKRGSHLRLRGERLQRLAGQISSAAKEIADAQAHWKLKFDKQVEVEKL